MFVCGDRSNLVCGDHAGTPAHAPGLVLTPTLLKVVVSPPPCAASHSSFVTVPSPVQQRDVLSALLHTCTVYSIPSMSMLSKVTGLLGVSCFGISCTISTVLSAKSDLSPTHWVAPYRLLSRQRLAEAFLKRKRAFRHLRPVSLPSRQGRVPMQALSVSMQS